MDAFKQGILMYLFLLSIETSKWCSFPPPCIICLWKYSNIQAFIQKDVHYIIFYKSKITENNKMCKTWNRSNKMIIHSYNGKLCSFKKWQCKKILKGMQKCPQDTAKQNLKWRLDPHYACIQNYVCTYAYICT